MPLDHLFTLSEAKLMQKLLVNINLTKSLFVLLGKSTWLSGTLGLHDAI